MYGLYCLFGDCSERNEPIFEVWIVLPAETAATAPASSLVRPQSSVDADGYTQLAHGYAVTGLPAKFAIANLLARKCCALGTVSIQKFLDRAKLARTLKRCGA